MDSQLWATTHLPFINSVPVRDSPYVSEPAKLFNLANNKPTHPRYPFLPVQTTIKAPVQIFLFSLCLLSDFGVSLYSPLWCDMPFSLGIYELKKNIFSMTVIAK